MSSTPVRIPDDSYETLREASAMLNKPLSETASVLIETGFSNVDVSEHLDLDPDLRREREELFEETKNPDSGTDLADVYDKTQEVRERQIERNRGQSDWEPEAQ